VLCQAAKSFYMKKSLFILILLSIYILYCKLTVHVFRDVPVVLTLLSDLWTIFILKVNFILGISRLRL